MAKETENLGKRRLGYALAILGLLLVFILIIVKSNYDSQAAYVCESIESAGKNMQQCPVHKTDTSWFFMAGFGIALLVTAAGAYFGFIEKAPLPEKHARLRKRGEGGAKTGRRSPQQPPTVSAAAGLSLLDSDSKKVFELIQSHEGSMFQSALVREAGFSKVKITRILDRLEQERLVERKRRGMANLVVLR